MRVVIADDEKFVLVVLKSALRSVRFPIEIVGEALAAVPRENVLVSTKFGLLPEKAGSFDHGYLYAAQGRTRFACKAARDAAGAAGDHLQRF